MKLTELYISQRVNIQLIWGEQKIEFISNVMENDSIGVYVTPYLHHGNELELNVTQDKEVICNLFADDPNTKERISWKNIELTTVTRNDKIMYCLKTYGFNHTSTIDDRRLHTRIMIQVKAKVFDGQSSDGTNIIIHDISDIGVSFYAPNSFSPKSHQVVVTFSDSINNKEFNVKLDCSVIRTTKKAGNIFVGCRIINTNRDFQLYGFMKRLMSKNKRIEINNTNAAKNSAPISDSKSSESDNTASNSPKSENAES